MVSTTSSDNETHVRRGIGSSSQVVKDCKKSEAAHIRPRVSEVSRRNVTVSRFRTIPEVGQNPRGIVDARVIESTLLLSRGNFAAFCLSNIWVATLERLIREHLSGHCLQDNQFRPPSGSEIA
jgi:hypothetical protein